jgi:DNA repair exonuclease SbcCD ATPase subunit
VRVKSVRLAWFRGAADPVALEADGHLWQNGAGKSSFVDAVEYAVNNGKLAHLTHEYSGRNQEKAIRITHTPAERSTELWMTFQDDAELHVKIAPNGTHVKAAAQGINLAEWDYRRTVLRQDEVAQFIRSSKGEKYSALLPLFGLHELEVAAENMRQLGRVIEQQSKLARKQGALQQNIRRREQVCGSDAGGAKIAALQTKYCPKSKAVEPLARCTEVEAALTQRTSNTNDISHPRTRKKPLLSEEHRNIADLPSFGKAVGYLPSA